MICFLTDLSLWEDQINMSNNIDKSFVIIGCINQNDEINIYESYLTASSLTRSDLPLSEVSPDSTGSRYVLAFLDGSGAILDQGIIPITFKTPHFSFPLFDTLLSVVRPMPNDATIVEIRNEDRVLLHLEKSSISPVITNLIVMPTLDSEFKKNISVEWQANHPEGRELTYSVAYSIDGGKSFKPIEGGLKETRFTLLTSGIGGSNKAMIKVTASDGFNLTEATSNSISIEVSPPVPVILFPLPAAELTTEEELCLRGTALDPQDGIVDGKNLEWFLVTPKGEHLLGNGNEVTVKSLPAGRHIIRLVATNQDGISANHEEEIIVKISKPDLLLKSPLETEFGK